MWTEPKPRHPPEQKYISSVDSGNLAGHLLVVGRACHDFAECVSVEPTLFAGIDDALHLLRDSLGAITDTRRTHTVTRKQLSNSIDRLAAMLDPMPVGARDWARRFVGLRGGGERA